MFKSNKIYGVYAALGLIPIFLEALLPTQMDGEVLHALTNFFPYPLYMGFALVGFLCFKLNQNRILICALLYLTVCYCLFNPILIESWNTGVMLRGLYRGIALSFPLTLALILTLRESRLMDFPSLGRLLLTFTPMIILSYLLARDTASFKEVAYFKFLPESLPLNGFLLPQLSIISLAILGGVIYFQKDRIAKPFSRILGITMIPLIGALWAGLDLFNSLLRDPKNKGISSSDLQELVSSSFPSLQMVAALTIICAILLHAVFTVYWQRVYIDELTDIGNRRALDEKLTTLSGNYTIGMMDIDHFKNFNDTFGHDEGDNVLRLVGRILSDDLGDKVYRYGGEEFCVVFKGASSEEVFAIMDRVRGKLADRPFVIRKPNSKREPTSPSDRKKSKKAKEEKVKTVQVTISIGLASPCRDIKKPADVIKLADQTLYQAKKKGRNCVVVWEAEEKKNSPKKGKKSSTPA